MLEIYTMPDFFSRRGVTDGSGKPRAWEAEEMKKAEEDLIDEFQPGLLAQGGPGGPTCRNPRTPFRTPRTLSGRTKTR
jgi:hypothetical protein